MNKSLMEKIRSALPNLTSSKTLPLAALLLAVAVAGTVFYLKQAGLEGYSSEAARLRQPLSSSSLSTSSSCGTKPTLTFSPNPAVNAPYMAAVVKNNDGSQCSSSTYSISATLPPGWTMNPPSNALGGTVAAGQQNSFNFSFRPPSNSKAMNYTIPMRATLMGNTSVSNTADLVYTIAAPSAPASISGKVTDPNGNGLRDAKVVLTDSKGVSTTVTSSTLGFYQFSSVPTNAAYTITVTNRRYRFEPKQITVTGNMTNVNFAGLE